MSLLEKATIAHVGVAVKDLDEAIRIWKDELGFKLESIDEVPGVRIAFFPAGEGSIELVQSTDPNSGLSKYVSEKGGGIHHICVKVPDIRAALSELKGKGLKLIDQEPRKGAHGHLVAFVHPKSAGGVLLELLETGH